MSPHIFDNISEVSREFDALLLDAYGVFWNGNQQGVIPGSVEAMAALKQEGKVVGILSNSTQPAEKEMSKVARHGIHEGTHYDFFVTSGSVGRALFLQAQLPFPTPKKRYFLFGGVHPRFSSPASLFEGTPFSEALKVEEADFLYTSIPHCDGEDQTDPERFRSSVREVARFQLPMLCPNPDLFAHEGTPPRAVVRQGSIARLYEEEGGTVHYIGKPYQNVYAFTMPHFERLQIPKEKILMVGDTPGTDIAGAKNFGLHSALLTQTGIMGDRMTERGAEAIHCLSVEETPDFFVKRL